MREVAVVATASRQVPVLTGTTEVQLMVPLIESARAAVGLTQEDIGFTCSGSSDFLAGQAFSFVHTLDAVGAVPPISESHVEMDGAFALYEAWVKLQIGEVDTALVYSYGKSSPGTLRDVLALQLDPYYLAPLWPPADAVAALQARLLLESGAASPEELAGIAVRSQHHAAGNPNAVRSSTDVTVGDVLAEAPVADPLRPSDLAAEADGGCAVVLAAGDRALAASRAGVGGDRLDLAELHSPTTSQEAILVREIGLDDTTVVNPSGGALAGCTLMAAGLMRIAEAADRITGGTADRALAHATSGPCLQQNLVCVLEGA